MWVESWPGVSLAFAATLATRLRKSSFFATMRHQYNGVCRKKAGFFTALHQAAAQDARPSSIGVWIAGDLRRGFA
jgi:hypothetical protein